LKKTNLLLLFLLIICITTSCSKKKALQKTQVTPDKETKKEDLTISSINNSIKDFKWAQIRSRVNINQGGTNYEVGSLVRMRKDSVLVGNATFMLEVGKLFLSNDSMVILNTLQREYSVLQKQEINNFLKNDDFKIGYLQQILLGHLPHVIDNSYTISEQVDKINIIKKFPQYKEEIDLSNDGKYLLQKYTLKRNEKEYLTYSILSYQTENEVISPDKISILVKGKESIDIELNLQPITFLETDEIRFKIPASYSRFKF
jgi:hypothetical protein